MILPVLQVSFPEYPLGSLREAMSAPRFSADIQSRSKGSGAN